MNDKNRSKYIPNLKLLCVFFLVSLLILIANLLVRVSTFYFLQCGKGSHIWVSLSLNSVRLPYSLYFHYLFIYFGFDLMVAVGKGR